MRIALVACLIACGSKPPATTVPPPPVTKAEPPPVVQPTDGLVPPQPTLRLPRNFLPTAYDARLAIDPKQNKFTGTVEIAGNVAEKSSVIWLHGFHLTIARAEARGAQTVKLAVTTKGEDLLEIRAEQPLEAGAWTLAFDYTGEIDPTNTTGIFKQTVGGETYVYTQLEALYARRVFPCFDEPNVKTPWKLTVDVPKSNIVVANTLIAKETDLDAKTKRVEFGVTKPLPTYLVAFGIGPFDVVDAGKSKRGTPVRVVTLKGRAPEAQYAAQTSARILDAAEDYFGTPYPFEKLDALTIPLTVGFGAMENAGLITYSEQIMLMEPKDPSHQHRETWTAVAAHEISHQWFGNLVTPSFWDDIWLNEGFATWLGSKLTAQLEPQWRDDQLLLELRNLALDADAIVSARRIRQPIDSLDDIFTAFDGITYVKGASVLRMFEHYVGEADFQKGIREYMTSRAWGNATSADFIASINKASSKRPIDTAFASFLDQSGSPELAVTTSCAGGKFEVQMTQRRYLPPGAPEPTASTPWMMPVCVVFDKAGKRAEQCVLLDKPTAKFALDTKSCPRWLMPNVDGRGLYRNQYTVQQVTALRDEAWSKLSGTERRAFYFDLKRASITGKLPLQLVLSFTPKLMAGGNDRFAVTAALDLSNDFNQFASSGAGVIYDLVPDDLRAKHEFWLRQQFGAAAAAVGFTATPADSYDVEASRAGLIVAAAYFGREPALVAEAVKLADKWRELPEAIRANTLAIAVDAKQEVFDKTLREVATEPSQQKRGDMLRALALVRDPVRYKLALALALDRKLDIRETLEMPFLAANDATREVAKQFVRENKDALIARIPNAQISTPIARYAQVFTATCKAEQRDAIADYVTKTFTPLPGGERVVKQAIEEMDQCIARRKILDPEIRAWLGGLRIPKPPDPRK